MEVEDKELVGAREQHEVVLIQIALARCCVEGRGSSRVPILKKQGWKREHNKINE